MSWIEEVEERASARANPVGPALVGPLQSVFGKSSEEFSPAKYGDYIATSNAVYACAILRARNLSKLPLRLFKTSGGETQEVTAGNLRDLLTMVNPFWTMNRLLEMTELSLGLWGKAFWVLDRGVTGTGKPREIWWARPDRMKTVPDENLYIKGFVYEPVTAAKPIAFTPPEILWLRYPNPLDEFEGLSPIAAARLAADTSSAAMKSNRNLFTQGMRLGGLITPAQEGTTWDQSKVDQLEELLERRLKGVDKWHRWTILNQTLKFESLKGMSPKDAEFIKLMEWTLEDVARAYGVPIDMIGGKRTFENVKASEEQFWANTMEPEARFIGTEITEQLIPLFSAEADEARFDLSGIRALQPDFTAIWDRERGQIQEGAITLNEWREKQGLESVPWGDTWWAPLNKLPVSAAGGAPEPEEEDGRVYTLPYPRAGLLERARQIEFGSDEHKLLWRRFLRRREGDERQVRALVTDLFRRQKESVLQKLRNEEEGKVVPEELFDMAAWIKAFRVEFRPVLRRIVEEAGGQALEDLGFEPSRQLVLDFDLTDPEVLRFLERRAQRFAVEINETTWELLRDSMVEGIELGEGIPALEIRVEAIMEGRIRSSAETIARTEVIGASNGGTLAAYRQSKVVRRKEWLAALDERTRTPPDSQFDHLGAHGERVGLSEKFTRTGEALEHPGDGAGSAGNIINCRCTMTAVLDVERVARFMLTSGDGHRREEAHEVS